MRKVGFLLIAALCCAFVTLPASADWNFAVFPAWYDSEDADSSFGGGVKFDWLIGDSPWGIELRGSYFNDLGQDLEDIVDGDDAGSLDIQAMPVDLGVNYHFMENENIWLGAGLTYAFLDVDNGRMDNAWGWYGTLGYMSGETAGGWAFYSELMYRVIDGTVEPHSANLETFDNKLSGWGVNLGVAYRF